MQTVMTRKEAATSFLRLAAAGQSREAFDLYVGDGFRHHNAYFKGDAASLQRAMDENAQKNPGKALDVQHAIEEGDLVVVHSHVRHNSTEPGYAVVHIFRFVGDHIVELWDLAQEVPADSPNENGMF